MPSMEITTQIGCKVNCAYCPQEKLVRQYSKRSNIFRMSFDTFMACIDKIPSHVDIDFSGMCEPWLNPDCTQMLLYAHQKGHKIKVFTTLVGMRLSDIDTLANIPLECVDVHLPSAGDYEHITVNEYYLEILDRLCKCLTKTRVTYLYKGKQVHPKVELVLHENQKIPCSDGLGNRANNIMTAELLPRKRRGGILGCLRDLHYNILLPSGDVVLCCNDYGMRHVLGNLLQSSYESLFLSEAFRKVQKGLWNASEDVLCRYCDIWAYNVTDQFCKDIFRCMKSPIVSVVKFARQLFQ